jgi:hypothetical protein
LNVLNPIAGTIYELCGVRGITQAWVSVAKWHYLNVTTTAGGQRSWHGADHAQSGSETSVFNRVQIADNTTIREQFGGKRFAVTQGRGRETARYQQTSVTRQVADRFPEARFGTSPRIAWWEGLLSPAFGKHLPDKSGASSRNSAGSKPPKGMIAQTSS